MNQSINGGYISEARMLESEFIYVEKTELPKRKTPIYKYLVYQIMILNKKK